jgi:hypothetical protein
MVALPSLRTLQAFRLYKDPRVAGALRRVRFLAKNVVLLGVWSGHSRGKWRWTFLDAQRSTFMDERRSHIRRRTFKGGKLIFNKGLSVLDCVIRDMSDQGARVELGATIGVPDTFELIIAPDRVKRSCKIAWRSKRHIGISFT